MSSFYLSHNVFLSPSDQLSSNSYPAPLLKNSQATDLSARPETADSSLALDHKPPQTCGMLNSTRIMQQMRVEFAYP
jgi:hypothetical protein